MIKTLKKFLLQSCVKVLSWVDYNNAKLLKIKVDRLSFLGFKDLKNLHRTIQDIESNQIEGIFIEAGCALGGSSIAIGLAKAQERILMIYDTFGMIPPPSDQDQEDVHKRYEIIRSGKSKGIGTDTYYGYVDNLKEKVKLNLKRHGLPPDDHNIFLKQGLFQNTMIIKEKVAFAHIDCDWYDSVMTSLQRIEPKLSKGGILVFDDYFIWSGCRRAVDDYFSDKKDRYEFSNVNKKLHVTSIWEL